MVKWTHAFWQNKDLMNKSLQEISKTIIKNARKSVILEK